MHECSYWSMETADWSADVDGGTRLPTPAAEYASLGSVTVGAWAPRWHDVVAEAQRRAPRGATTAEASCGPFSGVTYEGCDAEGTCWREWLLTLGELFLVVSYTCDERHRRRDRALVDRLLSTLA